MHGSWIEMETYIYIYIYTHDIDSNYTWYNSIKIIHFLDGRFKKKYI